MTAREIAAVATTLELIQRNPPDGESWDRPGTPTLAEELQKWLKEQL